MTATLPMTGPQPSLCGLPLYALINAFGGEPAWLGAGIQAQNFDELRARRAQAWGGRPIEQGQKQGVGHHCVLYPSRARTRSPARGAANRTRIERHSLAPWTIGVEGV